MDKDINRANTSQVLNYTWYDLTNFDISEETDPENPDLKEIRNKLRKKLKQKQVVDIKVNVPLSERLKTKFGFK